MKASVLTVLALSFGLLTQGGTCLAAELQTIKVVPKNNPSSNTPTGTSLHDDKKLYKPVPKMKISPDTPTKGSTATSVSKVSGAIPTYDPINSAVEALKRAAAESTAARTAYLAKLNECRNAEYSQADQAAAFCRETDTISACNTKLLNHCSAPAWKRNQTAYTALSTQYFKLKDVIHTYVEQFAH